MRRPGATLPAAWLVALMLVKKRAGMGAVIDTATGAFHYPSWCNWLPFAELSKQCLPPTQAEIEEMGRRSLDKVRAVNPALAAQGEQAQRDAVAADRRAHPDDYAAADAIEAHPTLAALLGAGGARVAVEAENLAEPVGGLVNASVLVLCGLALLSVVGGRR